MSSLRASERIAREASDNAAKFSAELSRKLQASKEMADRLRKEQDRAEAKKEQLRKERNAALNDASSLRDEVFKLEQELKFERGQAEKTLKWARQTEMEKNSAEANVKLLQVRLVVPRGWKRS